MSASVIVDDLDVVGVAFAPSEADTPLVVDADAELAFAPAAEFLESVAGRRSKIVQHDGSVQLPQPPERHAPDVGSESPDRFPLEEPFRVGVAESADHTIIITRAVM